MVNIVLVRKLRLRDDVRNYLEARTRIDTLQLADKFWGVNSYDPESIFGTNCKRDGAFLSEA